jgi:hypothetical protein
MGELDGDNLPKDRMPLKDAEVARELRHGRDGAWRDRGIVIG